MQNIDFNVINYNNFKIIIFEENGQITKGEYATLYNVLPPSRKQKVNDKFEDIDKKLTIIEYFMTKRLLKFATNIDFQYNDNGKPYIKNWHNFSISNCNNMVCVVCSKKPIGVDMEAIKPYNKDIAEYICQPQEMLSISNSENKDIAFTKMYTQKESMLKCLGLNMSYNFKLLNEKDFLVTFIPYNNHIICVSIKK